MHAKHFLHDPHKIVQDALKATVRINPNTALDIENKIVYNTSRNENHLNLISGGGSGHEPSFTGLVGPGFLDASVAGTIFASPSSRQIFAALQNLRGSKGVLAIVMNYTGDVLNFGVAVEKAKACDPQRRVEMLVVGDDGGVPRSRAGKVGRRGIAGTVLVQKILGAMSGKGYCIDDVLRVGSVVCNNLASVGVSLNRVHVPGQPLAAYEDVLLGDEEIELGMGIHNETGSMRVSGEDAQLHRIIAAMLRQLLDESDAERNFLPSRVDRLILLINNLGSLSALEVGAITSEVTEQLESVYGKQLVRVYCGTFMTSLDGPGFSITLLNEVGIGLQESITDFLDLPSNVPGWHSLVKAQHNIAGRGKTEKQIEEIAELENNGAIETNLACDLDEIYRRLASGLRAVIESEAEITRYDTIVGDGDCGTTLARGAQGILDELSTSKPSDILSLVERSSSKVEQTMDGTSGALYAIFLNAMTMFFRQHCERSEYLSVQVWSEALTSALEVLMKYTTARVGDRTLMDTLIPFIHTLQTTRQLQKAVHAATEGAEATKALRPSLGRSVYVGDENAWLGRIPDPGAWALSKFLQGLCHKGDEV